MVAQTYLAYYNYTDWFFCIETQIYCILLQHSNWYAVYLYAEQDKKSFVFYLLYPTSNCTSSESESDIFSDFDKCLHKTAQFVDDHGTTITVSTKVSVSARPLRRFTARAQCDYSTEKISPSVSVLNDISELEILIFANWRPSECSSNVYHSTELHLRVLLFGF